MAEVKEVVVTGEELQRRVRVVLEYSVQETEAMLNQELVGRIAQAMAKEWLKTSGKKMLKGLDAGKIAKEVIKAIVQKAVFHLATEGL